MQPGPGGDSRRRRTWGADASRSRSRRRRRPGAGAAARICLSETGERVVISRQHTDRATSEAVRRNSAAGVPRICSYDDARQPARDRPRAYASRRRFVLRLLRPSPASSHATAAAPGDALHGRRCAGAQRQERREHEHRRAHAPAAQRERRAPGVFSRASRERRRAVGSGPRAPAQISWPWRRRRRPRRQPRLRAAT